MKSSEVRIGSIFSSDVDNGYDKRGEMVVREISPKGVNPWKDMGASGELAFEQLHPIPVHPKRMAEAGFEHHGLFKFEHPLYPTHLFGFVDNGGALCVEVNPEFDRSPVYYLHELQNLFLALSGKSIIFKPR